MPRRAVPCRAVPCHAAPCRAMPRRAVPRAMPSHVLCRPPWRVVLCRAVQSPVPCRAVPCHPQYFAVPHNVQCRAVLGRVVPCRPTCIESFGLYAAQSIGNAGPSQPPAMKPDTAHVLHGCILQTGCRSDWHKSLGGQRCIARTSWTLCTARTDVSAGTERVTKQRARPWKARSCHRWCLHIVASRYK